jgi:cytochrome c oxidase assembly factor CtaG
MSAAATEIFAEWSIPWALTIAILAFAAIYVRGWFAIRKTRRSLFPDWRLFSYLLGLATLWLSICSPLDGFADALLSAHMVEHLILMSLVPPLVLLGYPAVPILRGLPAPFVRTVLGPFLRSQKLLRLGRFLAKPPTAWLLMNVAFLLWHIPAAYDLALENERLHDVEHLCFLGTSFLFWWPLIQPWPAKRHDYGWLLLPYLLTADFINTALSAYLAFCDRPVYAFYLRPANNPFHADPLADQVLGAGFMWLVGSIAFLLPAVVVTVRLLQGKRSAPEVGYR